MGARTKPLCPNIAAEMPVWYSLSMHVLSCSPGHCATCPARQRKGACGQAAGRAEPGSGCAAPRSHSQGCVASAWHQIALYSMWGPQGQREGLLACAPSSWLGPASGCCSSTMVAEGLGWGCWLLLCPAQAGRELCCPSGRLQGVWLLPTRGAVLCPLWGDGAGGVDDVSWSWGYMTLWEVGSRECVQGCDQLEAHMFWARDYYRLSC